MSEPVKNVVVLGGGTSGWLSACYLERLLTRLRVPDATVTLIESADVGIIGVGEATLPDLRETLRYIGIDEISFMTNTSATFKNAIRFVNWRDDPAKIGEHHYYHPFEAPPTFGGMSLWDIWVNLRADRNLKIDYGYLAGRSCYASDNLRTPKADDSKPYEGLFNYAYHLDAVVFGQYLRGIGVERGVRHITDNVVGVEQDERGFITALKTRDHGDIAGDLFIDCSGFGGLLINKHFGVPFEGFGDSLFCDRAVAMRAPYASPDAPINPFTTSTAMSGGWIWEIHLSGQEGDGVRGRRGIGYVYSSQFISDEDAERELRAYVGAPGEGIDARVLRMRVGRSRNAWVKNCVAIGLSGGFIEPLESTGISLIHHALELLRFHFPTKECPEALAHSYNDATARLYEHIREFIVMHYCTTQREDTEFWRANKYNINIPDRLRQQLEHWRYRAANSFDNDCGFDFFPSWSYRYILAGMRHLTEPTDYIRERLSDEFVERLRRHVNGVHARTLEGSVEHLEYLQRLYDGRIRAQSAAGDGDGAQTVKA